MTDDTPFLRTILDHPHEVGPRLVFADWLEERGDPWGELIRLQCELAESRFYKDSDEYGRGGPPFFDNETSRVIERCEQLLAVLTGRIVCRCLKASGGDAGLFSWRSIDGALIWWRERFGEHAPLDTKIFIWRGFPERYMTTIEQWLHWHEQNMAAFPFWYLGLDSGVSSTGSDFIWEDAFNLIGRYAGRSLMTLDVPRFMPRNSFTAWTCNLLDAWGEAAMKHTGQPFTLKIGQATMSGPPHSAAERWQAYCDRWLKDSNVRIVSRLEARPAGEAMPSG